MISKKKKIFLTSLSAIASFAVLTPIVSTSVINNSYNTTSQNINISSKSTKADETDSKSKIEVIDLGTEGLSADEQRKIKALYKSKPSNVETNLYIDNNTLEPSIASNSVFNIIKFKDDVQGINTSDPTKRPKIYNISNAEKALNFKEQNSSNDGNNIIARPDTPLDFFVPMKDNDGNDIPITQNILDFYGLLLLRVEYFTKDNLTTTPTYEYVWVSGFYSSLDKQFSSDNPTIAGTEYAKSVAQVTNNDLINYQWYVEENFNDLGLLGIVQQEKVK